MRPFRIPTSIITGLLAAAVRSALAVWSILAIVILPLLPSCDGDGVGPSSNGEEGSGPPFTRVEAVGSVYPYENTTIFVVGRGDSFVTYDNRTYSQPRHISELFVGVCPFETIGAIGSPYSFRGVFNGDGTLFAYLTDSTGTVHETSTSLGIDFPIGAVGQVGEDTYFFELGGTRVRHWGSAVVPDDFTERPVDAMGIVDNHVVGFHTDGRRFDSFIWNPGDIFSSIARNRPLEELTNLPRVWSFGYFNFGAHAPCDADGMGEFEVSASVTVDGETVGEMAQQAARNGFYLSRYLVYVEVPTSRPRLLTVTCHFTEWDFVGPDPRVDDLVAQRSHILMPDGTVTNMQSESGGRVAVVTVDASVDCQLAVLYLVGLLQ